MGRGPFSFRRLGAALALALVVTAGPILNSWSELHQAGVTLPMADDVLSAAEVDRLPLAKRSELCAGVDLRSKIDLEGSLIKPIDCTKALSTNGVGGSYFFTKGDQRANAAKITAHTDIARDSKLKLIPDNASPKDKGFKKTCDHVLELNILLDVLKSTGACDEAERLTDLVDYETTDGKKPVIKKIKLGQQKIMAIRDHIMRPENLIMFQARIEDMKTLATQRFAGVGSKQPWDVGSKLDFLAMTDYVLAKTVQKSQATAVLLDAEIKRQFQGNPGGVAARWTQYLAYILAQKRLVQQLAAKELREEQCKMAVIKSPTPGTGPRMVRRSALARFSPVPLSSLERRARGVAPRSGPKAPRGASCPCKQQPPKKQIPKKQTAMKPKPAVKPRQPAQKPAPRPRNPKKQVAKRPANRPRRTPGKAVTPRRTTPKRKPKPVPKPTRRPKGKPRTRRRK